MNKWLKLTSILLALLLPAALLYGADPSYTTKFYVEQGAERAVVASGGSLDVESGGEIDIETGGRLEIAGTAITSTAAELNATAGVVAGTVTANKAVVVGATKNIDGLRLTPTDVLPATNEGQVYWDDSESALKGYDGAAWNVIGPGAGNTLDQGYDQGGAGAGRAITVDSNAVTLTNNAADNNNVLEIGKSPVGAQSGAGLRVTMGANATGAAVSLANSGTGNDLLGSGSTWSISKTGVATFPTVYNSAVTAAAAGNVALTIDAAGNGTITVAGTSTGNIIFSRQVNLNGDVNIGDAATDTLSITSIIDADVTIDDGAGDSPGLVLKDATDETATFAKVDSGNATITTLAADGFQVLTGNLRVGNGAPGTAAMNGEDFYAEGQSEFDGTVQLDGAVTATAGITSNIFTGSTAVDEGSKISRNQAVTTASLLELETTHANDDKEALLVDHNATGAIDAIEVTNAGTGAALNITGEAAGSKGIVVDVANSATARAAFLDLGPWLGTADQGALEIASDVAATIPAGQMVRVNQQGTGQHAAAIDGSAVFVKDAAVAPGAGTSYAVTIDATNIEALHIKTGKAQFDEKDIHDAGIEVNHDLTAVFSANTEEANISTTIGTYAADSALVTIYNNVAGGQTDNTYLLRLRNKANGDVNDEFLVCEDNDGTDLFKVDNGGAVTIAGALTANGTVTGDGGDALGGFLNTVTNDADGKTLAASESGTVQTNAGAVGGGIWNLPEASTVIGMEVTIVVAAAQNLDVNPDAADQIRGLTNAAGDAIRSLAVGDTVTLLAIDATNWVVKGSYGTWADVN